jgi:hypothetical protein
MTPGEDAAPDIAIHEQERTPAAPLEPEVVKLGESLWRR